MWISRRDWMYSPAVNFLVKMHTDNRRGTQTRHHLACQCNESTEAVGESKSRAVTEMLYRRKYMYIQAQFQSLPSKSVDSLKALG